MYSSIGRRNIKQQKSWPRLDFLIEKGGGLYSKKTTTRISYFPVCLKGSSLSARLLARCPVYCCKRTRYIHLLLILLTAELLNQGISMVWYVWRNLDGVICVTLIFHSYTRQHMSIINNINPFRTAVPFWGQSTWNLTGLSPQRDCGSKIVLFAAVSPIPVWGLRPFIVLSHHSRLLHDRNNYRNTDFFFGSTFISFFMERYTWYRKFRYDIQHYLPSRHDEKTTPGTWYQVADITYQQHLFISGNKYYIYTCRLLTHHKIQSTKLNL